MRNGAGTYSLPPGNPVIAGTVIESTWANSTMSDIAVALTDSLTADGQTNPVANLPMNGFHHLNVSDPTLRNQYLALGMAQDGLHTRVTLQDANPNTLNGTMVGWSTGNPAFYPAGLWVSWFQVTTNTGAVTMNVGGLGAASVFSNAAQPLIDGDLPAGIFCLGYYNGTQFQLITDTTTTASSTGAQSSISGYLRPIGGYDLMTLPDASNVDVPAGNGFIVTPGSDSVVTAVSWETQTVALAYLASAYSIAIMADDSGAIVQYAGAPPADAYRTNIMLGTVIIQGGNAVAVFNSPAVYGDDDYLARDSAEMFNNTLVSGGRVTPNVVTTVMDISAGEIFNPGGNAADENNPNLVPFDAVVGISFRALAGASTLGSVISIAPMAAYDPAGGGTVTALAGTEAAIHRLYLLGDQFIWAYGQSKYTNFANALLYLNVDRSTYQPSTRLSAATLICEIIAQSNSLSVNDGGVTSTIISSSSQQYLFGSANSINDAPSGGLTYGRRGSDSSWQPVLNAIAPVIPGDFTILKSEPRLIEKFNPIGAGWAGLEVQQDLGFDWFNIEAAYPDDKVYFRSYNPATGALRASTTFDLATGLWAFPAGSTVGGLVIGDGDVHGPASAADGEIALFDGATGKLLKAGLVAGDVVGSDLQPTPTDTTAGGVLTVGSFGLGTTGALSMPIGTTLQRPVVTVDGQTRINTTTGVLEYYYGSTWNSVPKLPAGYISGLSITSLIGQGISVAAGSATTYDGTTSGILTAPLAKNMSAVWSPGGLGGIAVGGRASGAAYVNGAFYRVFLISKPDGTSDVGFDTSTIAANLLSDAASYGYTKYRRIGWIQAMSGGSGYGSIRRFSTDGNRYFRDSGVAVVTQAPVVAGTYSYSAPDLPVNVTGIFSTMLERSGTGIRYCVFGTITNATISNFDIASEGTASAIIEQRLTSGSTFVVKFSGACDWTMIQMGWIDDTSNLLNV